MRLRGENPGHAAQAAGATRRANQQQRLAAQLVDQRHADNGEQKIRCADGDCLLVARNLAEAGGGEDVVQVVQNCVDPGELVESADRDGEEQRIAILPLEDPLVSRRVLLRQRRLDVGQFRLRVRISHHLQHRQRFIHAILRDRPARAARNSEEQRQENQSRNSSDAHLQSPFRRAQVHGAKSRNWKCRPP